MLALLRGPLDRQGHAAEPIAFSTAEPALQVEHLHRGRQAHSDHQANPWDQLIMAAGDALDAEEIAIAKVFDPRIVQGPHAVIRGLTFFAMFSMRSQIGTQEAEMIYRFASALDAVIEQRKHHTREAKRLRSVAPTITTAALKARVLEQAREHATLAGLTAEGAEGTS